MTAAHFHLAGSIGKRSVYSSSAHSVCRGLAKSWHAHFRVRGAGDATQYFNKWDADGLANRSDTRYFTKTPIN
jgi:hypothetical protein